MKKKTKVQQQEAAPHPPKERCLDSFIPTSYMALLEGSLLANGDLKVYDTAGVWSLEKLVVHDTISAFESSPSCVLSRRGGALLLSAAESGREERRAARS